MPLQLFNRKVVRWTLVVNNKLASKKLTIVQRTTFKHISVYTEQFSFICTFLDSARKMCCPFVVLLSKDATVHWKLHSWFLKQLKRGNQGQILYITNFRAILQLPSWNMCENGHYICAKSNFIWSFFVGHDQVKWFAVYSEVICRITINFNNLKLNENLKKVVSHVSLCPLLNF